MDYKLITFYPPYNKSLFYKLMGKFFSERVYRKKMPYLINTSSTFWYVVLQKNEVSVCAFSSFEVKSNKVEIGEMYCSDNVDKLRLKTFLLKKMFKDIKKNTDLKKMSACVDSIEDKQMFEKNDFLLYKKTKNFYFFEKDV
ncbi:hypothetical protein JWS91_002665 [Enterococcus faecalis]|nr:hypothetical protein [Enterococcus faecalis]EHB6499333.1 hypothetical protein [Enterococcus faecalis]